MARPLLTAPATMKARRRQRHRTGRAFLVLVRHARHGRNASRGFTLVELSAVVVIIGVLAVISVVGYRKYIQHSKISEAQAMISAIRIAQEDFKAERGTYANPRTWCPTDGTNGNIKTQWNSRCTGWQALPVHADGMVLFGYNTAGGPRGFTNPFTDLNFITWTGANTTIPWYVIVARADLDNMGGTNTTLGASSFTNQIFIGNEGQ